MTESICLKSQNGCVVKGKYDNLLKTLDQYRTAKQTLESSIETNGTQQNSHTNNVAAIQVLIYIASMDEQGYDIRQNACDQCPYI